MSYDPTIEDYANLFYQEVEGEPLPSVGDGVTYSRALGWQSPEGNFYGQERWVRDWPVGVVWDGEDYRSLEVDGEADSEGELPVPGEINPRTGLPYGPRQHFEVWSIPRPNWPPTDIDIWDGRDKEYFFWDSTSESWQLIEWFYDVDGEENLRRPGLKVGAAHVLWYYDIKVMWNGLAWVRLSHEMLDLGENDYLHLTDGFMDGYTNYQTNTNGALQFLQSQQAEARLEFISKTNLGLLSSVTGKTGALWVGDELLLTDDISNVENTDLVLQYSNGTITTDTVDPNTEYHVYCGNSDFSACASGLFLSKTPDINGKLGDELPGTNARIVGVVETDNTGYFVREIDMSYIGRKVEFSQTFWEYSDYQLQFVDEDNLAFNRIDGTHGLFYVNGQLLYLGTGKDLNRADYRIEWNDGPDIDTSDITTETTYQIYIANDSIEYNFNNEDGETGFPYEEGHPSYISALDFRRQLFLSTQPHDHRVFNQEYPGYYARHIGQIQTDGNGRFRYAADISLIRQPTLNPTHLDGLAECVIQDVSTTQFKVIRKKGTTGIIYVGGKPVQTYDADNPLVHIVTVDDALYEYDETEIDAPLTESGITVAEKPGISIYLYLANDIDAWQGVTTFCSLEEPHQGYLSVNWPGNQARWLATIQLAPSILGNEKVTNGSFATDTGWTKGTGWSYDAGDQNMLHTPGNSASLSQNVSAVADELYACIFYITGRTAGIAAPKIGGTSGQSISGNTSSTQYLLAVDDGDLEIIPDTYFDGSVDNVSVKKVTTGQFSGTYIKDSVGGVSAQIDDSIVSSSTTYSSNKIEQIRQQLLAKINLALGLNGSHTAGLDLQLEYVDSTTIKLKALTSDVDVIFPNLETVTVTTTGITKTVSGSTSTLYYVYLVTDGTLAITTNAPTDEYSSISFYGETHVLVGWLGCSASNTIAGTHNIFSFWNEPQRTWTQSISSSAFSEALNLNGLVVPSGKIATASWTGSLSGTSAVYFYMFNSWNYASSVSATSVTGDTTTSGSVSGTIYGTAYTLTRSQRVSLSSSSFASGVHNASVSATPSRNISVWMATGANYSENNTWAFNSGTITLARPGS